MKQTVTILRYADRHANVVNRDFAEVDQVVVEEGQFAVAVADLPVGRYSIQVSEPHE